MAKVKFFISSFFASETLGPPRGPALVQWNKTSLELCWRPPKQVPNNEFEYLVEILQNDHWTTLGITKEPQIPLVHLGSAKSYRFKIYSQSKRGNLSKPLITDEIQIPGNFGLAIEEVFDEFIDATDDTKCVKIEEIEDDKEEKPKYRKSSWRQIPILIEEVKSHDTKCYLKRWNLKPWIKSFQSLNIECAFYYYTLKIACKRQRYWNSIKIMH